MGSADGGDGRRGCVFCGLIGGLIGGPVNGSDGGPDPSARWVAQEPDAVAFAPRPESALAPGHTLVVPRVHCVGVLDAPPDALAATTALLQRVGRAMTAALGATGVVVLNASGPHSGQSVPHLHFHLVPCRPEDGVVLWPRARSGFRFPADAPDPHALLAAALPDMR